MKRWKENLIFRYSVVSFIILTAIAFVISHVLSSKIRSDAIDAVVEEAVGTLRGRLLNAITATDLENSMTGERYRKFNQFARQSLLSDRTARVKIWSRNGTVIYSDDKAVVGMRFSHKENLRKALRGENAAEIQIPRDVDNSHESQLGTLVEVYTPIVFPGAAEPQGVFEIYQYYDPTAKRIGNLVSWVFALVGGGALVLYGSLAFVVWGSWKTIKRQENALRQSE